MRYSNHSWNIILPWVLVTTAGFVIGVMSILTLVASLSLAGASPVLVGIVGGAALGGGVGVAQWLVLRHHIRSAGWWVLVSAVGGMIGVAIGLVLSDALRPLLSTILDEAIRSRPTGPRLSLGDAMAGGASGAVIGLALGSAQWLVLRRHARSAGWWIVVSCLGWMIGLGISAGLVDLVGILGGLLIVGVAGGAATGSLLARLVSGGTPPARQAIGV